MENQELSLNICNQMAIGFPTRTLSIHSLNHLQRIAFKFHLRDSYVTAQIHCLPKSYCLCYSIKPASQPALLVFLGI